MPEMKRPLQLRCWLPRSSEFFGASSLLAWQFSAWQSSRPPQQGVDARCGSMASTADGSAQEKRLSSKAGVSLCRLPPGKRQVSPRPRPAKLRLFLPRCRTRNRCRQ
jgi:hypothetical protein